MTFSQIRKKKECISSIGQMRVEFVLSESWKNNWSFCSKEIEKLIYIVLMTSILLTAWLVFVKADF